MPFRFILTVFAFFWGWWVWQTPEIVAQNKRIEITDLRVGFPAGPVRSGGNVRGETIYKRGQWTPIWVGLECFKDTDEPDPLLLTVSTVDDDNNLTEATLEIPPMAKGETKQGFELGPVPYLKLARQSSDVTVTIRSKNTKRTLATLERVFYSVDLRNYVVLGIGNNLGSFEYRPEMGTNIRENERVTGVDTATIMNVGYMPDRWFGYGAVDLVVLSTGNRSFFEALAQDKKRCQALVEWVRRGGSLVISGGLNPDVLNAIPELVKLLPGILDVGSKKQVPQINMSWRVLEGGSGGGTFNLIGSDKSPLFVTPLKPFPNRRFHVIGEDGNDKLIVQSAFGMGRVTYVGFDLDRPPFSEISGRTPFWTRLITNAGPPLPALPEKTNSVVYEDDSTKDYANLLQGSLDFFEGTPPISFGWVALFIFIYIILIGPVDYFILKKVIRRMEWTWVTFPIIVIVTSTTAYFAAYYLKGRDLKINKVDVVDIDLGNKRLEGYTWFTLFGPRTQKYKIGIEPAGPEKDAQNIWTPDDAVQSVGGTLLSWQGRSDNRESRGGSFFQSTYKYPIYPNPNDPNEELYASGLSGVPINVWTTKSFHARWSANVDAKLPPFSADLVSRGNTLQGTVTNNTGIEQFTDVALIWRGRALNLDKEFPKGSSKPVVVAATEFGKTTGRFSEWIGSPDRWSTLPVKPANYGYTNYSSYRIPEGTPSNPNFRLWRVLFHTSRTEVLNDKSERDANASLRYLDQSWRVQPQREDYAILVLRVPTREGPAETMATDPASPSRLWLGAIPAENPEVTSRPSLQGILKQETYIRVIIPVKIEGK